MSSILDSESLRGQRREERRRRRAAQESAKAPTSGEKTAGKDERKNFPSSDGRGSKKPTSGVKRVTIPSYEKVNIIEKTARFDSIEKENKGKQKTEASMKPDFGHRKSGSKFLDNLSKFETRAKQTEEVKKTPFVRSFSSHNHASSAVPSPSDSFRRSYRAPRATPGVEDPSILTRRSLRKERVLESIAKLERKSSSSEDAVASKMKPSSPVERCEERTKSVSSRPSSAGSSKASLSDSGSSTCSTKGLSRAQQALERHKERMRKSPHSLQNGFGTTSSKATTPTSKCRQADPHKTPRRSKSHSKGLATTPSAEKPKVRKISITAAPVKDDIMEVTTVTEVTTPTEGKMNIIVKELAASEEESEKLFSPTEGVEYKLGDPRPVSVEDSIVKFSEAKTPELLPEEKPKRVRRKLPDIPTDKQYSEARPNLHSLQRNKGIKDGGGDRGLEERRFVIVETSPSFSQASETVEASETQLPAGGKSFQFSHNYNENSNLNQKDLKLGQNAITQGFDAVTKLPSRDDDQTAVEAKAIKRGEKFEEKPLNRAFSPDEAIEVLRRLSEEVHSQSTVTEDQSASVVISEVIIEEADNQGQYRSSSDSESEPQKVLPEKRPSSLHIEEVLYISEEADNHDASSKQSAEEVGQAPYPRKPFSRESPAPVVALTPSPQRLPGELCQQPSFEPFETELTQEVTLLEGQSCVSSPDTCPNQSKNFAVAPVHVAKPEFSPKSFINTPTSVSAQIELDSQVKSLQQVSPKVSVQEAQLPSPLKDIFSSTELVARSPSPTGIQSLVKTSPGKMIAAGRTFAPRYRKSWLDESDSEDDVSLLSDAESDASSIDMDWLGKDSSDNEDYVPKKVSKPKPSSSSVQRTTSSAQDMLKMWEKKATEPKPQVRSSPSKLPSDSANRVGSARSAWETKNKSSPRVSSHESIDSSHEKHNGNSQDGIPRGKARSTSSTASQPHSEVKPPPGDDVLKSPSGSEWKLKASESEAQEMMGIFDDKMSGKIQGAKALFENLSSSPKRSPSLGRSPRRPADDKRLPSETGDEVFSSRKSSISQASESSEAAVPAEASDSIDDSPSVDDMRAMFENKKNQKPEARRNKTSLAEMVADDDSDVTDVRSIKAMWESMDNHR